MISDCNPQVDAAMRGGETSLPAEVMPDGTEVTIRPGLFENSIHSGGHTYDHE